MKTHKQRWWDSMIETHGSEDAVRKFLREKGAQGGSSYDRDISPPRGFATLSPERMSEVARIGGAIGGKAPKRKNHDN